ncbi:recombinase family protein [Streptomyces acidicola]
MHTRTHSCTVNSQQFATPAGGGRLVFHVSAALAEFIRELIVAGTREGLDAARGRGRVGGRRSRNPRDHLAASAETRPLHPGTGRMPGRPDGPRAGRVSHDCREACYQADEPGRRHRAAILVPVGVASAGLPRDPVLGTRPIRVRRSGCAGPGAPVRVRRSGCAGAVGPPFRGCPRASRPATGRRR